MRERSSNGYINQFNGFCLSVCRYDVGRSTPGTFRNRNEFFCTNAIFCFFRYLFFSRFVNRPPGHIPRHVDFQFDFDDSLNRNRLHMQSGDDHTCLLDVWMVCANSCKLQDVFEWEYKLLAAPLQRSSSGWWANTPNDCWNWVLLHT